MLFSVEVNGVSQSFSGKFKATFPAENVVEFLLFFFFLRMASIDVFLFLAAASYMFKDDYLWWKGIYML